MGIINMTPDSFYAGSRKRELDAVVQAAGQMMDEGATFIDIGGQSTRPGSKRVSAAEEGDRVIYAIEAIHQAFPQALISIDSFYSDVVRAAVHAGASIVNDVSACSIDPELAPTVAFLQVPYVLMHMKGDPQTMQLNPVYDNVVLEVFDELNKKMNTLIQAGIKDIIIDPGFGFGKTIAHNLQLLSGLSFLQQLNKPILVGLSRKATIYKSLGITPEEALNGTTVLNTISLMNGASILRVHDVRAAVEAIHLTSLYQDQEAILKSKN
ncbi:MAG TPA: dihydropteroate synthase [Flavisolibacter sp.]|nr:dihydropteroate synthase [Flavisolibacter sp.]